MHHTRHCSIRCHTSALVILACCAFWLLVAGCGDEKTSWAMRSERVNGLTCIARTQGEHLLLHTSGGDRSFIPGVNLGATIPGRSPGEVAPTAAQYRRWFRQIGRLGLRALRIYTILPPRFYVELVAYNRAHPVAPLYLVQGVWIPEEEFLATRDLFSPPVRDGFRRELTDACAAVHGELQRQRRAGSAWGTWTADASRWLLAYSIGVEWDPVATAASDEKNSGCAPFTGIYYHSTRQASPTESWLAAMLDYLATQEASHGSSVPLTFTNWPTTDPLEHPDEPLEREDLVGVDANHIHATTHWPAGFFASYHVYPYYPDFQRYEPALLAYRLRGRSDPYAGYIAALRRHHQGLPVMITEFGVPSSTGLAHRGPLGRDQGNHSEQQAMSIDADLLRIIHSQGYSGAFVFEWADEWFKFTWNTIDYELPADRRQLWRNPWTNEEHFGLLAMEPGRSATVVVDGDGDEWNDNNSQVIFEGRGEIREVRAVKDEAYLYLRLVLNNPDLWRMMPITLGFDVLPGGNRGLPGLPNVQPEADYAVVLGPGASAGAYVRASNDQYAILYGKIRRYVDYAPAALLPGSGVWNLQRLIANRPLTIPTTGRNLPAESVAVGALLQGTADPNDPDYDSRTAWSAASCIEVRLPWEMIGFADPSSRRALRVAADGTLAAVPVTRVGIVAVAGASTAVTSGYSWDPWQRVTWHERLKRGLSTFAAAVRDVQR